MASEEMGESLGRGRPRRGPVDWWRELGEAQWPRILRVAVAAAAVVTVVAATVSLGRDDEFLRGDLTSLAFGVVVTVVLGAGLDERAPPAARTIARMIAIVAVGYVLSAMWVVVAALATPPT